MLTVKNGPGFYRGFICASIASASEGYGRSPRVGAAPTKY